MSLGGDTPETYRDYLRTLCWLLTADPLRSKLDLSGIVQQTLLDANTNAAEWTTWSEHHRANWIRLALSRNLTDAIRHATAERRDVSREISLDHYSETSSGLMDAWLAAEHSTPSERASREEQLQILSKALSTLPGEQRVAVELHHLAGFTLDETATHMGKTVQSVVGLLYRGLKQLREQLSP